MEYFLTIIVNTILQLLIRVGRFIDSEVNFRLIDYSQLSS